MCGHGAGDSVCTHESLARLQLPLKCSSDQDEREGSPSPNHLALIAGRNASLRPPVGRGHAALFVNPAALGRAGAKGERSGTKGGFSWAARTRQPPAEMLGVRAPRSQPRAAGPRSLPGDGPCTGGFASCPHLRFLRRTGACWPFDSRSCMPARAEPRGRGTWEPSASLAAWQGLLAASRAPGQPALPPRRGSLPAPLAQLWPQHATCQRSDG